MQTQKLPFVTILMPIRNEAKFIERSLKAVLSQDYPPELMEVLVIDGMSTDGTREIVKRIIESVGEAEKHGNSEAIESELTGEKPLITVNHNASPVPRPPSLVLLDNPAHIVPTALNIGLKHARGDVIIRVDGHCEIAPDYVRRCVEVLQETGADCVGGLQRAVGEGWVGRAIALATSSPFGVGNARFHYDEKPGWVDTVYLGAYRHEVFERVGGFDEELACDEDDEFNFRLIQAGGKIWLDPSIRSVYYCRTSLRSLWKQYFRYGFYKVRVIQKRRAILSWRHLVPATFVLGLAGSFLLAVITAQPLWALCVAGPYALANLLASFWTARKDWKTLPVLPLAFATLHLSYGIGFLWGLWRWRGKWKKS